jgi:ribose 5-phosphate isomerase B
MQGEHMRIGIAADHGGFGLKGDLRGKLAASGHEVVDFGASEWSQAMIIPAFVIPLTRAVAAGTSVCANEVHGSRRI